MKWKEVGAVLRGKCVERMLQRITAPCDNNHDKEEMSYILSEVLHINIEGRAVFYIKHMF